MGAVPQRTQPQPCLQSHAAMRPMPVVHGGAALGLEVFSNVASRQNAQRHRRVGRAEGGGASLCHVQRPGLCHQAQAVDIGGLALVRAHSQRGVALQMLHRHIAFALRQLHIGGGYIMLKVQKSLVARVRAQQRRGGHKDHGISKSRLPRGQRLRGGWQPKDLRRLRPRLGSAVNRLRPALGPHHAACAELGVVETARDKAGDYRVVLRLHVAVRGQVHGRRPTARHADQIHVDPPAVGEVSPSHMAAAGHIGQGHAGHQLDARSARGALYIGVGLAAQVRHLYLRSSAGQCQRIGIGRVVVDAKQRPLSRCDRVTVDVLADGVTEHHARFVIAREHQRALNRPAGHHDGPGAHGVLALARNAVLGIGHTWRAALHHADRVAVVDAKRRGAGQGAHLAGDGKLRQHLSAPARGSAVHRLAEQSAAHFKILLHQQHIGSGAGRSQGRGQTGSARSDHQYVGVNVVPVVAVHIKVIDAGAQTGGFADEMFVEHPRVARRPHESLVIEPGHEHRRQQVVDRHQVELDRGPGVLRARHQAVFDFGHGGGDIGLACAAVTQRQEGVGLFDARSHDAARAVVFEGARHQMLAMGQQGRGQRVTGIALEGLSVEREAQAVGAVHASAVVQARCAAGVFRAHGKALCAAGTTEAMSWLTVLRCTTSQRLQPSVCCQNSVCRPLGLLRV